MSNKNSNSSKAVKRTAAVGGALAAAFVPQYADAEIVTVGGDGGTGAVTLSSGGEGTDIGGNLLDDLFLYTFSLNTSFVSTYLSISTFNTEIRAGLTFYAGTGQLFNAARSSVSTSGTGAFQGPRWSFYSNGNVGDNAVLGSSDNWVPGTFRVNGVNGGNEIFGWLQVELGSSFNFEPSIISFTYDDEATDTTRFAKPVGGFSIDGTAVPEPTSLPLLTLLALGAGGLRRHRKCTSESSSST